MATKTLRVRAAGEALVPDYDAMDHGVRRFIGRKWAEVKAENPKEPSQWGWEPTGEAVEVPYRAEYARDIANGDLEAADDETARMAGAKPKAAAQAPQTKETGR